MGIPHYLVFLKVSSLAAFLGGLISIILQSVTGAAGVGVAQTLVSVVAAGIFSILLYLLKERSDRKKRDEVNAVKLQTTDQTTLIDREKLVDGRVNFLMQEQSEFYALRDREKDAINGMLKELGNQKDGMINQQRELIAQQAATIVSLQKTV